MSSTTTADGSGEVEALPDVDERLVAPGSRYEIWDGKVVYVPPADEPHGELHARLAALVATHRADGFLVAVDMLTRTSKIDDIAPDVSVYPAARTPTGGRQLEQLAFEIASTESLSHAGGKAAKLVGRGVRRVFAIDVERMRMLEWSKDLATWSMLDPRAAIEDPALAVPLPIEVVLAAARSDAAIARALRTRRHEEFVAERAEGRAEGRVEGREEGRAAGRAESILQLLAARGLAVSDRERAAILAERDLARLDRWIAAAVTCTTVAELLSIGA